MFTKKISSILFVCFSTLLGTALVNAHAADKAKKTAAATAPAAKPTEPDTLVLSDSLTYDDVKKTSVFSGNVILTRGQMRLTSDRLDLRQDADGKQAGKATMTLPNAFVLIREERPETYETLEAKGHEADYDGKANTVTLIGNAVVIRYICGQAFDTVSGSKIIYNNANNTYSAMGQSGTQSGRVRSIAQPKAKTDAAAQECRIKYHGKPMPSTLKPSGE